MSDKDTLMILHEYSITIANVMSNAGVKPPDASMVAIMVIVAKNDEDIPIGGSLNWDKEKERWTVHIEANQSIPLGELAN